ncbi:MAG: helix-turn-helix domain-containing protein [Magnetospirillum sp.]|nr:helix-turn-helix domain-containing protein [Magnetospirillum sp.]
MDRIRAEGIVSYAEIVGIIGEAKALHLSKVRGGRTLYIPSPQRLGPNTPLVEIVGAEAAEALAMRFGGAPIDVPLSPGKRARVWELREARWTIARIAGELKCTERTIYNILAGPRPRALGEAAPAELPPLLAYIVKR